MSFDEIEMPAELSFGFRGGFRLPVSVTTLSDGHELRQAQWASPLGEWTFDMGSRPAASVEELRAFWVARRGGLRGFRFKDWTDFEATAEGFGTGDAATTTFQLTKTYAISGETNAFVRTIRKPETGVTVYEDGVESPGYSVNTTTGVVTFSTAPGDGVALTWTGEFRVPVRFVQDQLEVVFHRPDPRILQTGTVTVRELRR